MRAFILVMGLALAAGVSGACGGRGNAEETSAAAAAAPSAIEIGPENVVTAATQEIRVGPLVSGELQAARSATVRAEVGGSVLRVHAEEGDAVTRGRLLVEVEARDQADAVQSAQSALKAAEQSLDVAQREAERTQRLVAAGALAERETEVTRNAVAAAEAQVADAKARLASARLALGDATVRAPMSGVVSARPVSAGDVVAPGAELYTIIDPSSMRLEASVPSEELQYVKVGVPVVFEVRGYPDQSFEGRIERISPAADPVTRQVPIFVSIPNSSGRLLAGLFAEGRITREVRTGVVVPETAVNLTGDKPYVMKVRDGKVERANVTVGLRDPRSERIEIEQGISEGDRLLVGAAQGITAGTPVKIRNAQPS